MKEVGAALAGRDERPHVLRRALVRLRRRPLRGRAAARDPVARTRIRPAVLDALPDALSTPELNRRVRRRRARMRSIAKLARPAHVSRRDRRHPHRRAARRVCRTASASRARRTRRRSIVLRFEADDAGGADADPGRVPPRADAREARRRAAVLTMRRHARRLPTSRPRATDRRRHLRVAVRRVDPAVAAHRRARLLQARLPAAHRQLQGARRAQRAAAAHGRAAPARRDRGVGGQSRAGHRVSRRACSAFRSPS